MSWILNQEVTNMIEIHIVNEIFKSKRGGNHD